ncbi:hypothetical protein L1987_69024 [Smallanthus sonchifolius]|uniref:Uncharacterized protein n=1 Tax=Smallanthus sonchifolius TaxID=185202 RepID=A0ACB9B4R6_9ASTR|nr:hypothetical protein L1987_69024 [Smallanthus sonchifolius]
MVGQQDKLEYNTLGVRTRFGRDYWWPGMKHEATKYVSKCLTCSQVKAEHQKPYGKIQPLDIPEWKWEHITMDFITKLPHPAKGHDTIWVKAGMDDGRPPGFGALQEVIKAGKKDISLLKYQLSQKCCVYTDAKEEIKRLTAELKHAKSIFAEAKFKVEFFGQSSKVVDMLETQLHKPGNGNKGLGYNNVPHPFNGNCITVPPSVEEQVREFFMFTPGSTSCIDESKSSSSASNVKCVNNCDASTSCAEKVETEECDSENDESEESCFCKNKTNSNSERKNKIDTFKGTDSKSNKPYDLSKLKEKSKLVEKPRVIVQTSSASPKHFTKAEFYIKYDHHHKRFEQDHAQKNMTYARCLKRRCDQSYHSKSSSSWSNRSGYASYSQKQTYYTCGKAGHIARNCMHRPYEPYYMKNERTTPRDKTSYKPMKANQPRAMKNQSSKVKPSDGDWNVAKRNIHAYFERQKVKQNKQRVKPKVSVSKKQNCLFNQSMSGRLRKMLWQHLSLILKMICVCRKYLTLILQECPNQLWLGYLCLTNLLIHVGTAKEDCQ